MDPFQLCKIKKTIWASWESSRHIICGFWSASSIHANNAVHHWIHIAVVGTLLTATAQPTYPLSSPDAKERPREWPIVNFDCKYNGELVTLLQTTCNKFVCRLRHCANWFFLEAIKNRHLLVDLFDDFFGTEMMRLWRMSIMLENSLILFMYCFVLVNSRPANCDSLMELGQSSTSTNYSRFPEACLKRRNSCALKYFGVLRLVLSRRKLSCEQFSSLFSLTTFTTHSSSVETGA